MEWLNRFTVRNNKYGIFVNGQRQGVFYVQHFNGQTWYETNYVNGQYHGYQRGWYDNGQIMHEFYYEHGQLCGFQRKWDEDGNMIYHKNIFKEPIEKIGWCIVS
jgi:antitoxin component YwqK of YwqJK toxin-antitoxin module